MTDNLRPVSLPGGGTAWILNVWPHAEASVIKRHFLRRSLYTEDARDLDGMPVSRIRRDLTPEQQDEWAALADETRPLHVRTFTRRSEGVTDAFGEPISLPEQTERMRADDLESLAMEILKGSADPNAGGPPSTSSPGRAASPRSATRTSAKASKRS